MERQSLEAGHAVRIDPFLGALVRDEAPERDLITLMEVDDRAPGHAAAASVDEEGVDPAVRTISPDQKVGTPRSVQDVVAAPGFQSIIGGGALEESIRHGS